MFSEPKPKFHHAYLRKKLTLSFDTIFLNCQWIRIRLRKWFVNGDWNGFIILFVNLYSLISFRYSY